VPIFGEQPDEALPYLPVRSRHHNPQTRPLP
jgi:hypothetical protein